MRFRIFGVDAVTGEPVPPTILEAPSQAAALLQAKEQGIASRGIELADGPKAPADAPSVPGSSGARKIGSTDLVTLVLRIVAALALIVAIGRAIALVADAERMEKLARSAGQEIEVSVGQEVTSLVMDGLVIATVLVGLAQLLVLTAKIAQNTRGESRTGPSATPAPEGPQSSS